MEEALVARLRANTALAALVATKNSRPAIDWMERGEALPCVTLQDITAGRNYAHDGATELDVATIQIDCWATSYGSAKLIARAVRNALEANATQSSIEFTHAFLVASRAMDPDDLGSGIKVYRQSLDFDIWHQPA